MRLTRLLSVPAALMLIVLASACAPSGVYVGVAVPGPWVGYPGYYPPPGIVGPPRGYWYDDDQEENENDDDEDGITEAQFSLGQQ